MKLEKWVEAWGVAALAASAAGAQLAVDAGPDVVQDFTLPLALAGQVSGQRPFDYWMGDGDLVNENQFVCYDDATGFRNSGNLVEIGTQVAAGWPSDVVEIAGEFYGVETGNRYLWKLVDFDQGLVQQIGPTFTWPWVTCLAYDHVADVLYGVDGNMKQLLVFDYTTGAVTPVGPPLTQQQPYWFIKGLAYDEVTGLLWAIDDNTETLFTIDPATSATAHVMNVPSGPDLYDELQSYDGALYASFKTFDTVQGWWVANVRRIEPAAGLVSDRGPLFDAMSPHTLLIRSFPEETEWRQVAGPGTAAFADFTDPATTVTFSAPGTYLLELQALGSQIVSDLVQVDALAADCNANGVEDADDIAFGTSLDIDGNGVPDECEVVVFCTAKVNSLGCTPAIFGTGTPSVTSAAPFTVGATQVLNQRSGLLFYAYASKPGSPFQGGTLCGQPPLRRLPIQSAGGTLPPVSDCSGQYSYDFNAHVQSGLDPLLTVGQQVACQWWSRDPGHPDGTGTGLTDALQFYLGD